jgi:hypothetical protein
MIFHTASSLLKNDHIIQLILTVIKSLLLSEGDQIITDLLGMPGTVRNRTDLLKIGKYRRRLKTCQFDCFHNKQLLLSHHTEGRADFDTFGKSFLHCLHWAYPLHFITNPWESLSISGSSKNWNFAK